LPGEIRRKAGIAGPDNQPVFPGFLERRNFRHVDYVIELNLSRNNVGLSRRAVGGLGTLAASWTELAELRGQIGRIVSATANAFCVNLVLAFDQRDRLELLLECGVPVVSFSWGIDAALIGRARQAGLIVLVQCRRLRGEVSGRRRRRRRADRARGQREVTQGSTPPCRSCERSSHC
jgi:hypothetical protein